MQFIMVVHQINYSQQVVLVVSQIFWARDVTKCLNSKNPIQALQNYRDTLEQQLNKLAEMVRGTLTPLQRGTLGALITVDVHARDIVDSLIQVCHRIYGYPKLCLTNEPQEKVTSESDFGWIRQLRYYWKEDSCMVLQANAAFR